MRSLLQDRWAALVEPALKAALADVTSVGQGRWRIEIADDRPVRGEACISDDWLMVRVELADGSAPGRLRALQLNAGLPGGVRFAMDRWGRLLLHADAALEPKADVARRVEELCAGLNAALDGRRADAEETGEEGNPERWGELCEEAGWPFSERAQAFSVRLETEGAPGHALFMPISEDGVRLRTLLGVQMDGNLEPPCREALRAVLLTAGGVARLAAACLDEKGQACFQVSFGSAPAAQELNRALSALSVAREMCARELKALTEPDVAEQYLAARGRAPRCEPLTQ